MTDSYALYYWPFIPGRGEYPRLVLEAANATYVDIAREPEDRGGGLPALRRLMQGERAEGWPFAPPFLAIGDELISHSMLCSHAIACREQLVPTDDASRNRALGLALTLADLVDETHDTHHPLGVALYYEEQKREAARRAESFRVERLPRFLGYFEGLIEQNREGDGTHLLGARLTYPDLALFHTLEGLDYAFPRAMRKLEPKIPRCRALQARVREEPRVAAYLASDRRLPFNEDGVFRHYPELDADSA